MWDLDTGALLKSRALLYYRSAMGKYGLFTDTQVEQALQLMNQPSQTFEQRVIHGNPSWANLAESVAYALGYRLQRQDNIDQTYLDAIELDRLLRARSGKAIPKAVREMINLVLPIAVTIRGLLKLTNDQSVEDLDDLVGKATILKHRLKRLTEIVGPFNYDSIGALVKNAKDVIVKRYSQGSFVTRMMRASQSFGEEPPQLEPAASVDQPSTKRIKLDHSGPGVRVEWDDDF